MKTKILFLFIILPFSSCKREDVDIREQYTGEYDITSTYYNPAGSGQLGSVKSTTRTEDGLVSIDKSTKPNVLLISTKQAAGVFAANLQDDGTFTLEPVYNTESYIDNKTYQITRTGEGRFIGSSLKLLLTVKAPAIGLTQTVNVVGTKR